MAHVPLIVLQGAVPMLGLYIMKLLLDAIADAIKHGVSAEDRWAAFVPVLWLVAAAAGTALLGALLSSAESVVGDAHARAVADAVARTIHERAAGLDLACFEDPEHYDTLYRAQQEAPQRPMRIVRELAGLLRSLVLLAFMGGLLVALHWSVPFLVIAAAVPAVLVRMRASRELFDWQQNTAADQREAAYLSSLLTGRAAAKEVRAFDLGDDLSARFDRIRKKLREDNLAMARRRSLHGLLAQMPAGAVLFSAYAWLGWRALAGEGVTIGDVAMYAQAIQRCLTSVQGVLGALAGLGEHRLFLSHYFAFLDLPCRITAPAEPKAVPAPIRNGVRCEGVVFRYPGQREPVLRGVDLDLRMGEKVGLVGPNGAGKSTLVQLLCRLHDPEDGFVHCDGIDLRSFDPAAWRRRLGVLFQDALPLEFTALENVTMALDGQPAAGQEASRRRALAAMDTAGIGERLARLPQGADTRLGRRFAGGQDLSAGEWRKLLLARAVARQADLLVLDEPSAFLDARAELELFERLTEVTAGKALLLISHRPLSLQLCDRIYVMEQGRIVEAGVPKVLAARDGPYARLFAGRQQVEG